MTRRAALYARYSSDLQRDASIEDQLRSCRQFAEGRGYEILVQTYTDRAASGASLLRAGIQQLLADARAGRFDIVVAEALDRLSRNQADVASLYQQLAFHGVTIETLSEGPINELHIGLTGTMNALFLKELGKKTHRGLKGRALAGRSAGGICYGYRAVRRVDDRGEAVRGERRIAEGEARVVVRIFSDYARGISPKKIAAQLNAERVPGPRGGQWSASTIHGNRERGTGILNNELYVGRLVWDRLAYVKDPSTGKRVSRLKPEEDWVVTEVPALRIVDQALWDAVRTRQGALKSKGIDTPVWDRRRPRYLFSGLMRCGCCGSGFSKISADAFGCSAARNKGPAVCTNRLTIKRDVLEGKVLEALANHLMDPELVRLFCEEYVAERNRLAAEADASRAVLDGELARVKKDHARLVQAILDGVPGDQVKEPMIALDARRQELEKLLADRPTREPAAFHPSMAKTYRDRVAALVRGLGDAEQMEAAKEALRELVDRIVLTPDEAGAALTIDVQGDLAGLLTLATSRRIPSGTGARHAKAPAGAAGAVDFIGELVLVAGAGFEPAAFRL